MFQGLYVEKILRSILVWIGHTNVLGSDTRWSPKKKSLHKLVGQISESLQEISNGDTPTELTDPAKTLSI